MKKILRKTLLYKSGVEYADFGLNHVEGCSHGCTYPCYAMMMKKRCGIISGYKDWTKPKLVANALELLEKEIPKYKKDIKSVYMCFATDPFMYNQEEVIDLSLKIIERLNKDNIKVVTISKGVYPKALTKKSIYGISNEYGSTVISLSKDFQKKHEPGAAPIQDRIKTLKILHDAGLKTWVSMEPYPTPNFIEQNLEEILEKISFVDKIVFGKWNYNGGIGSFTDNKKFYNDCAYKVIHFCQNKGIACHIKNGTIDITHYEKKSVQYKKALLKYSFN
jgi:DNA repair photolyase